MIHKRPSLDTYRPDPGLWLKVWAGGETPPASRVWKGERRKLRFLVFRERGFFTGMMAVKLLKVTDPEDVLRIIDDNFIPLPLERIPLDKAGGRVLGETVFSREDIPGFNRSTVDGYAVIARDTFGAQEGLPAILNCKGEVVMGQAAPSAGPGQCVQIPTGGMLPSECDAVVMVEDTETLGSIINCYRQVAPGKNVIHRGEDISRGKLVLPAGCRLRAPELGLLASLGLADLAVHRRPVMDSSSGTSWYYHAAGLLAGQIRDCNAPALSYLGRQAGATIEVGPIIPDSPSDF